MTVFDITSDPSYPTREVVRVLPTHIGKGVFAMQVYPAGSVIGEISGRVFDNPDDGDDYSFDLDEDGLQLEPHPPFRYLNHCCDPNCEFDDLDENAGDERLTGKSLHLFALRDIFPEEQLTIDYNWSAESAIRCDCQSPLCRGWVVAHEELSGIVSGEVTPRREVL